MVALHSIDDVTGDERRTHSDLVHNAHRRLRDSRFNMYRWPAFVVLWAIFGCALLIALIYKIVA